jgi:phage/plasmid-like protein (TIGR03299 family)
MSRKIWLNYGKALSKNLKTAEQAIKDAQLAWNVEPKQIQIFKGSIIPNKVAIVRSDTQSVLGIVNSTYKYIQNVQSFSFLDDHVKNGDAQFYAAGHIGLGEKVWLLLKLHNDIKLSDNDLIQKYILFSNAHDGRGAIRAYFMPLRQQTQTLLNVSFGKRVEQGVQMRHVGKVGERIQEAKKIFGLAKDFYETFENSIEKLLTSNFKQNKVDMFFSSCFDTYSLDSTRTQNTIKKINELYQLEVKTNKDYADTAWAWLSAVTNFIDHSRLSKGKDTWDRTSNHVESLFWGSGLLLKQKAWNIISSLTKI